MMEAKLFPTTYYEAVQLLYEPHHNSMLSKQIQEPVSYLTYLHQTVKMTLSIETTVGIVSLLVSAPCTAIMLWKCARRRQKSVPHVPNIATHLSEVTIFRSSTMIYASEDSALEAGLLSPHVMKPIVMIDMTFAKKSRIQTAI